MQNAQQSVVWLGQFVKQRRETLGLKPRELADRTSKSLSSLEKVENGTRSPGLEYLTELFDALGVALNYRSFLVNGLFPGLLGRLYGPSAKPVTPQEQAFLNVIHAPTSYIYLPSGDLVGTNSQWERLFPGMNSGSNLIEYLFCEPMAHAVFTDWEEIAHSMVFGLKLLGPGALSPARIEEIRAKCSAADPRFDKMWSSDLPSPKTSVTHVRLRDVTRGTVQTYAITVGSHVFPGRRNWMVYSLVPAVEAGLTTAA